LATTFVNGFLNVGFSSDLLMTTEGDKWVYKNKDHGMLSASASLGLIYLWDYEEGLTVIDRFLYSDPYIKAGTLLAQGIINSGLRNGVIKHLEIMENLEKGEKNCRICSIIGIGIACAGTKDEGINSILGSILSDEDESIEILAFTALALGQINVGTCDGDISSTIIQVLTEQKNKLKNSTLYRFLCLGMGLLFLGSQDKSDAITEICRTLDKSFGLYAEQTIITCAYTGTGNVIQVQKLLKICGDHIKEEKEDKDEKKDEKKEEKKEEKIEEKKKKN